MALEARKVLSKLGLLGMILAMVSSCQDNNCSTIWYEGKNTAAHGVYNVASFDLEASVSLAKPEDLLKIQEINRPSFCLVGTGKDATVKYNPKGPDVQQPCFNLMYEQALKPRSEMPPSQWGLDLYRPINPDQFLLYYQSIPPELNKFLVIQAHHHNLILNNVAAKMRPFSSTNQLWDNYLSKDRSIFSFYGVLHTYVVGEQDSFIFIYLPLNLGIETLQYAGVLTSKADYKIEASNFANPAYKLTPSFHQTLLLSSSTLALEKSIFCDAYQYYAFSIQIPPENLRPVLAEYQKLVQDYLQKHPGAFPDPYAQP